MWPMSYSILDSKSLASITLRCFKGVGLDYLYLWIHCHLSISDFKIEMLHTKFMQKKTHTPIYKSSLAVELPQF